MASYNIAQYAYGGKSSCLLSYPLHGDKKTGQLQPVNILGSQDPTGDFGGTGRAPYQQIILNGKYYSAESEGKQNVPLTIPAEDKYFEMEPYFLRLTLPRNANYDLNFALLLITEPPSLTADLDQMAYQFIRYIHVPRSKSDKAGQSFVIAYERPKFYQDTDKLTPSIEEDHTDAVTYGYKDGPDVMVKEVKDYSEVPDELKENPYSDSNQTALGELKGNIYVERTGSIIKYWEVKTRDDTSNRLFFHEAGDWYGKLNDRKFAPIGATAAIINHSWIVRDSDDVCTYDIIFKPRDREYFSKLYLYLIPESWDNDITWLYEDAQTNTLTQFYGRHVDLKNVKVELYKMKNLVEGLQVKRMGIWGRSELMFTINGEEIKIGPSGYYELQDFDIDFIGVAALDNRDQFTLDVQYAI